MKTVIEQALVAFHAAARDNEAPTGCEKLAADALAAYRAQPTTGDVERVAVAIGRTVPGGGKDYTTDFCVEYFGDMAKAAIASLSPRVEERTLSEDEAVEVMLRAGMERGRTNRDNMRAAYRALIQHTNGE